MAEPDKKAQQDIHLKIKANKNHSFFTSVLGLKNKNIVKLHQYVKTAKPLELPLRYHWVKRRLMANNYILPQSYKMGEFTCEFCFRRLSCKVKDRNLRVHPPQNHFNKNVLVLFMNKIKPL